MKKGTLFLSFLLCLTGCEKKQPKIDKSRFDSAQVTLYYRNAVDPAYPETFRHINPVLLNSKLTEKFWILIKPCGIKAISNTKD